MADPQGKLTDQLKLHTLPSHLFLDQLATIKDIKSGLMTKEELEQNLLH